MQILPFALEARYPRTIKTAPEPTGAMILEQTPLTAGRAKQNAEALWYLDS